VSGLRQQSLVIVPDRPFCIRTETLSALFRGVLWRLLGPCRIWKWSFCRPTLHCLARLPEPAKWNLEVGSAQQQSLRSRSRPRVKPSSGISLSFPPLAYSIGKCRDAVPFSGFLRSDASIHHRLVDHLKLAIDCEQHAIEVVAAPQDQSTCRDDAVSTLAPGQLGVFFDAIDRDLRSTSED
jgi:hypothetical protein